MLLHVALSASEALCLGVKFVFALILLASGVHAIHGFAT